MGHTEGPWRACYSDENGYTPDRDEELANLRLAASAHELLAALTRAYHALSNIINASDNCECGARGSGDYCKCPLGSGPYKPVELQDDSRPDSFMADCNLAYAAIAKATGRGRGD